MPIIFDSATSNSSGAPSTTLTTAHTCSGANRVLFVGCSTNAGTTTGVTYAGVAMTLIASQTHTGLGDCTLWYLANPATGSNNIVSTSSVSTFHNLGNVSFTGASQTGIPDATSQSSGTSSAYSNTLTTGVDNCVHIAFTRFSGASVTAGASTTLLTSSGSNWNMFRRTGDITPPGSSTLNITASSSADYAIVGASFKPSMSSKANFFAFM